MNRDFIAGRRWQASPQPACCSASPAPSADTGPGEPARCCRARQAGAAKPGRPTREPSPRRRSRQGRRGNACANPPSQQAGRSGQSAGGDAGARSAGRHRSPGDAGASTPPPAAAVQTADPFGEEITLAAKSVVILKGSATWDNAFESLVESLKTLTALLDKQGIKPTGNMMIVYTSTDDSGFTYQAEIPVDQEPEESDQGDELRQIAGRQGR